jgi:hypothetical protein
VDFTVSLTALMWTVLELCSDGHVDRVWLSLALSVEKVRMTGIMRQSGVKRNPYSIISTGFHNKMYGSVNSVLKLWTQCKSLFMQCTRTLLNKGRVTNFINSDIT